MQWFTATKYSDGYTAGYEQEYPLKKDLLIITPEGIEKTMTDGIALKNTNSRGRKKRMINLILGNSVEKLKELPSESVDMILTSPPYDKLRHYNHTLEWNFEVFKERLLESCRAF